LAAAVVFPQTPKIFSLPFSNQTQEKSQKNDEHHMNIMNVQAYFPEFQQSLTSSNWPSITQTTRIRDYSSLTQ